MDSSKEDMIRRVTGQKPPMPAKPPVLNTPMPANLPGVKGNPPLPQGRVVGHRDPSKLTPHERQQLESIGWDDSMPIPKDMAAILRQQQERRLAEAASPLPPPIDPRTPKMAEPKTVPIDRLDAGQKERLRRTLTAAAERDMEEAEERANVERMAMMPKDAQIAYQMVSTPTEKPQVAETASIEIGEDDENLEFLRKQYGEVPSRETLKPEDVEPEPEPEPKRAPKTMSPRKEHVDQPPRQSETGVEDVRPSHCPHCSWNLGVPDVAEPPYIKKMAFLQAILEQSPYVDEVELFGGTMVATFRSLTPQEIEAAYKQAFRDQITGKIVTDTDYWERLNRYRLYMQLKSLKSTTSRIGFVHDLPDGLNPTANDMATSFWHGHETEIIKAEVDQLETALPLIETWLFKNVLKSESILRMVNSTCNEWNRQIAKLEAMVDNSDFWKGTGEQS